MNRTHYVQITVFLWLWFGMSSLTHAQADTLQIERHVFGVKYQVYHVPLDKKYARRVMYRDSDSRPAFRKADIITGTAIASLGVGTYWIVEALQGVPAIEVGLNGQEIPYTIRSQSKFVGGMMAWLVAGCLSQYALDLKVKAVRHYNHKQLQQSSAQIGYLSSNRIGFRINLP